MKVHSNTDHNVEGHEALAAHISGVVGAIFIVLLILFLMGRI